MSVDLSQFHQVFFDEAHEHLATMESLLLSVDLDNPSLDDLNAIFRAAHSIKGGAGTFGFSDVANLTHALETLLDRLRKQELAPTEAMIDAFLQCCDVVATQIDGHQNQAEVDQDRVEAVKAELLQLAEGTAASTPPPAPEAPSASHTEIPVAEPGQWLIHLHPKADIFAQGASFEALTEDLQALGELILLSDPEAGNVSWQLSGDVSETALRDLFAFICEADELTLLPAGPAGESGSSSEEDPGYGFFSDDFADQETTDPGYGFFVDESTLKAASSTEASEEGQGYGFFIEEESLPAAAEAKQASQEAERGYGFFVDEQQLPVKPATPSPAKQAPPAAKKPAAETTQTNKSSAETSIRVGVEKVDQLINLVGELVITRSMLAQSASALDPVEYENIHNGLANLERNSRDLQEAVMSIRMLPINFVFGRFPRVVRDLTKKMNKKVRLNLVGEDTELDKGLIEKLADPLTHLVRNSIDHGIETPEERLAKGKPEEGTITLSASHQGGSILVEIFDDGAGLSREKLLAKAEEKGIPLSDNPSDKEVWQLIFAAGFSTAKEITDVSGRGVGMDVVKRNINEMKGQIEIDSSPGAGTRIGLRLPLTLAILDGMSLRVGEEVFILPLTRIKESLQPTSDQLKTVSGKGRVVHIRGEYLPLLSLHEIFNIKPQVTRPEEGILVVVEAHDGKLALFVDELIAQDQVVIKSLETHYRKVDGISGATIMGDGRVALIIDIERLAKMKQSTGRLGLEVH